MLEPVGMCHCRRGSAKKPRWRLRLYCTPKPISVENCMGAERVLVSVAIGWSMATCEVVLVADTGNSMLPPAET